MSGLSILVAGLAFGDESKGATTEHLCRKHGASLVVRYNGASQTAHNVVSPDGTHHTFSQFGSGSFVPDVKTHLSKFMLVDPIAQMREEEHLWNLGIRDMWRRTTIDKDCIVVTPIHRAINRIIEKKRGKNRHGSCGVGIGAARCMHLNYGDKVLLVGDLHNPDVVFQKLRFMAKVALEELAQFEKSESFKFTSMDMPEWDWIGKNEELFAELVDKYLCWPGKIVDRFTPEECMVFEGAQGVLLDEKYGTAPHNTWTNTTFRNAHELLNRSGFEGLIQRVGCLRTYFTRHGAGPFPTEGKLGFEPKELHNAYGEYQGGWRTGSFDFDLARYALEIVGGVDYLSLSHCDVIEPKISQFEAELGCRVGLQSYGPTYKDRVEVL